MSQNGIGQAGRIAAVVICMLVAACAPGERGAVAPPPDRYATAELQGYRDIRFYGDVAPPFLSSYRAGMLRARRINPAIDRRIDLLALSGGGAGGAYGAGFLNGWTLRGDRPEFTWVTGVSTGALIAPFAFLGPDYDAAVARLYTQTPPRDIFSFNPFALLVGGDALGDSRPLAASIAREITPELVDRIAAQERRGRKLLIATTNLDAQRPVIWDIGRIADSGQPDRVALIHKILLASASIPGAFPPVNFDVVIDGQHYQEMHVDGGVTHEIFAYPVPVDLGGPRHSGPAKTIWVIRNTKVAPEYTAVQRRLPAIAQRSVSTLIKYQGRSDIALIERLAQRDGFDFRLTAIPADFSLPAPEFFEPAYMRALFRTGRRAALAKDPWRRRFIVNPD